MKKEETKEVTLETIDARVGSLEQKVERIEADVSVLKTDVSVLKTEVVKLAVGQEHLREELTEFRSEVREGIEDIALQSRAMVSAVTEALTQLNLSRSYERRIARLEARVFGTPEPT